MIGTVFGKRACLFLIATSLSPSPGFSQSVFENGNWQRIETENGAIYHVDLRSIVRLDKGAVIITVYEGRTFNPRNRHQVWFDCQGRYRELSKVALGEVVFTAPRSAAEQVSRIACNSSGPPKAAPSSKDQRTPTRTYTMELRASGGRFPSIVGSTDLPDGTRLLVSINKPRLPNGPELLARGLPACEDNCIPASGPNSETLGVNTFTLAGAFSAGPFSWNGKPFHSGRYEVEVYLYSLPDDDVLVGVEAAERLSKRMANPVFKSFVEVNVAN